MVMGRHAHRDVAKAVAELAQGITHCSLGLRHRPAGVDKDEPGRPLQHVAVHLIEPVEGQRQGNTMRPWRHEVYLGLEPVVRTAGCIRHADSPLTPRRTTKPDRRSSNWNRIAYDATSWGRRITRTAGTTRIRCRRNATNHGRKSVACRNPPARIGAQVGLPRCPDWPPSVFR